METTEIILRDNGTLLERRVHERVLDAGQSVLDALTNDVSRAARQVFKIPDWGWVHGSLSLDDAVWTVPIDRIPLDARFRLVNGVLVPVFGSASEIEMPLVWHPPKDVRLAFVVQTQRLEVSVTVAGNWLFACDGDQRAYRLPLPNLHDDCRICTGDFKMSQDSCFDAVAASLEQFRKSKWNADLMRTVEKSQKFFRFRPTNETFETLPVDATDWTMLCDKVSTVISERIVL